MPAPLDRTDYRRLDGAMGLRLIWTTIRLHTRETVVIAALVLLTAGAFLLYGLFYDPAYVSRGFGPGWNCSNPGDGGSICVKNGGPTGSAQ
jgi:hypothetical protein